MEILLAIVQGYMLIGALVFLSILIRVAQEKVDGLAIDVPFALLSGAIWPYSAYLFARCEKENFEHQARIEKLSREQSSWPWV